MHTLLHGGHLLDFTLVDCNEFFNPLFEECHNQYGSHEYGNILVLLHSLLSFGKSSGEECLLEVSPSIIVALLL